MGWVEGVSRNISILKPVPKILGGFKVHVGLESQYSRALIKINLSLEVI